MRWWLNTDDPQIFAVDNASVSGMDFSSLPPELYHVQWIDGRGELENQVDPLTNDNGLRETFIDVAPYAPLFQQFLAKLPLLTLGQAQQVQTDLIKQLFESKRQEPFHYTVAAGDFWWDASDEALFSSHGAQLQNSVAAYSLPPVTYTASATITIPPDVTGARIKMWGGTGGTAPAEPDGSGGVYCCPGTGSAGYLEKFLTGLTPGNTLIHTHGPAGAAGVYPNAGGNGGDSVLASGTQSIGTLTAHGSHGNNVIGGLSPGTPGGTATGGDVNQTGQTGGLGGGGVPGAGGSSNMSRGADGTTSTTNGNAGNPGGLVVAWDSSTVTTGMQWIPIGGTTPVPVTPAEQTAILNGIAARTNTLAGKKNTKVAEVKALTAIPDVIAYDVTTGW